MSFVMNSNTMNLQATLASASSTSETYSPHHPITCQGKLYYEDDNTFRCEHGSVPPDDARTQQCVTHSVALLLIELAMNL